MISCLLKQTGDNLTWIQKNLITYLVTIINNFEKKQH